MSLTGIQARIALTIVLLFAFPACTVAESAASDFKAGQRAESKEDFDTAFQAYRKAHDRNPSDPRYTAAYLRVRLYASAHHIHAGDLLHDHADLQGALAEYRLASEIDPSNFQAMGLLRQTTTEVENHSRAKESSPAAQNEDSRLNKAAQNAAGPIELSFKADLPISIQMATTTDVLYKTIGKLGGLNVLIDPEYKPQKLTFELKNVTLRDALDMLSVQSKTFWRPLSSNTILVTADTASKRKDLEQSVMKTFYLHNAETPDALQAAAGTLKGILDINHIQVSPDVRSLTLRGTPDQMIFAEKLLSDLDKPKAEVIVEVMVLEVSRNRMHTFGAVPPTTVSAAIAPVGSSTTGSGSGSGSLTLGAFAGLGANDISVTLGGASFTALESDSGTKVLQRPELRIIDSDKASLKIGDRIPIATGSFQSGLTQGVNTQFQYIDVGVNIDITPYVHSADDVTLKMSLEISSVTGETTISGVTEPTIGQRRIEHETRLADGEVNLIAGILQDTETKSMSGYPWLTKIPILKYLFGQEAKERQESEIVFAVIPHIIRSTHITDDNLRAVDLGSPTSVTYRAQKAGPVAPNSPPQSGGDTAPNKGSGTVQHPETP
jgi:general secretion pathway protein D